MIFKNEPHLDFSKRENREWMMKMITKVRSSFPIKVPAYVDGKEISGLNTASHSNPCLLSETVAQYSLSSQKEADAAVMSCQKARESWSMLDVTERVRVIRRCADLLAERRQELMALMVLEEGKNFKESNADVCEAVDFCRYYSELALKLFEPQKMGDFPGEDNVYFYRPRGVCVAIAPWNFPLAILTGMTVAPLVCGNAVVMKPAEQSSVIGLKLYEVLIEAGVPAGTLHFLPGRGEEVGAALVVHPGVHAISFTGSRDVGLNIMREAARLVPGQNHIKKVVAEMGGKNAIIADDDADLDEAVLGALDSAFGYAGQKCSALSRLIVLEGNYDKFKERFVAGLKSMKVGPAEDVSAKIGAVIDSGARERLMGVIDKHQGKICYQTELGKDLMNRGNFVPPTVFEETDHHSDLGQKEFFGPLVTLFRVRDFDEAVRVANDVDYALTGGIYTRNPAHVQRARAELEVGNLYINRGITGALVGRQPFGGFKLSGAGGKAGGPDYLLHFVEPRTITENTMRRGFAPGCDSSR